MTSTPSIVTVASLEAPGLETYRTLRRQTDHFREGIFVAEGEKVVRRLLASGLKVRSMLLTPEWRESLFDAGGTPGDGLAPFTPGAVIYLAAKNLLEGIVGYNLHQGVMAVGETPAEAPLESFLGLGEPGRRLFVAVDDLVNAENVGLVVRNCAALGADGLICGETSSSPWLRRAVRASMGTVFGLPIHHSADLAAALRDLGSRRGFRTIAADPAGDANLYETRLDGDVCIVVGHEGTGIRPPVLAACSGRVSIPMWRGTDSLNVSSACAVFLSEARRQRHTR
jgi:tRNA G18 (ribose-2'-O)-methylase SpoU